MNKNNLDKMLHKYIEIGDLVMVKGLIMAGADPSVRTERGLTPLHLACQSDNPEVVKLLINSVNDGEIKELFDKAKSLSLSRDVRDVLSEALTGRAIDEATPFRPVMKEAKGAMFAALGAPLNLGSLPGSWASRHGTSRSSGLSMS